MAISGNWTGKWESLSRTWTPADANCINEFASIECKPNRSWFSWDQCISSTYVIVLVRISDVSDVHSCASAKCSWFQPLAFWPRPRHLVIWLGHIYFRLACSYALQISISVCNGSLNEWWKLAQFGFGWGAGHCTPAQKVERLLSSDIQTCKDNCSIALAVVVIRIQLPYLIWVSTENSDCCSPVLHVCLQSLHGISIGNCLVTASRLFSSFATRKRMFRRDFIE